jgi:cytochrome c-type biogenesis protein CcmH
VFWTLAFAILFFAAIITFFPILRARSLWQALALALIFLVPTAGLWLYGQVGTPEAIEVGPPPVRQAQTGDPHSAESEQMDGMIEGLRDRLEQDPENLDGWMLLARTLRATEDFPGAAKALEQAYVVAPDNPFVMVELAEAWVYLSPDGRIQDRSIALLERALTINPSLQKGQWLMGMSAAQRGDDRAAIGYWEALLEQLEPGSSVAQSVQTQIADARVRLGIATEPEPQPQPDSGDGAWTGTEVTIDASLGAEQVIQNGGVLYVMIRSPGPAMGPPIGVRRIVSPAFPLNITISDADSMLAERKISSESEVQIQARVSLTGTPAARSGDWQSVPQTVQLTSGSTVEIDIDQKVE